MYEDLLPIGSVVLLVGGNTRLMIVGRLQARKDDQTVYDYVGCFYPDGIVGPTLTFFNRDAIKRVYFIGFQDVEELRFREEVLAPLGELYVDENGQVVEREPEAEDEAVAEPEPAVFADVE